MARVDFYLLAEAGERARLGFACRLAEKAHGLGHRLYLCAADAQQARRLDELLWTFRKGSFVPHRLESERRSAPVLIGAGPPPETHRDVLINLGADLPPGFDGCERILEVVDPAPEALAASRSRFRAYREAGCSLETHRL